MRYLNVLVIFIVSVMTLTLSGCGSSRESDGAVSSGSDALANAAAVGIDNCLICHNINTPVTDDWLNSRHGNDLLAADKEALNYQTINGTGRPDHSDDDEDGLGQGYPNYDHGSICFTCHDALGDGRLMNSAIVGENERPIISCESCHGGGQFHNGIAAGIPIPSPDVAQCGECHGVTSELFHSGSGSGNNVRRNITDTHIDDPATGYNLASNLIEGYVIKTTGVGGCKDCHVAHLFDLTINNQWASSPHGGHIKGQKDAALEAGLIAGDPSATLLANVKAAGADSSTGDGWVHYDWDDSAGNGPGGRDRGSCQRCHTSTGLVNFLADSANYDDDTNNFSHLDGWAANKWSGQNEMLYCWGCHANTQTGEIRTDANGITLDFLYEDETGASGPATFVVLPDKGNSNVCAACHAGRGNNTSIRSSYAEEAAAAAADGPGGELGGLSSRFSGHHAPTAGSLYAAITHTGFEFEDPAGPAGTPLDYTTPSLEHDLILEDSSGPCAGCHMGGDADHHFAAVDRSGPTTIENQALCDTCHGGMTGAVLDTLQTDFEAARDYLDDLVDNVITNHLGIDISASANRNAETLALNDFGAFQNSLYMNEEPCIRVHNSLYGKRLLFDSIDWLQDGSIDGTLIPNPNLAWLGGSATRP